MDISLKGLRALICGSTQGIGKAIAIEFAASGASCILLARNEEKLKETVAGLPAVDGQSHSYLVADFTDPISIHGAISPLMTQDSIHIVVNNTGGPAPGPITAADSIAFTNAFTQHVVNYQQIVQMLLPGMQRAGYGRVINIVSTSVKVPIANLGVSNTIRAATAGWAKTLSLEVAKHGITVNNILPGYTETARLDSLLKANAERQHITVDELAARMTEQIPARRFGRSEEIATLATFLASPAASYINGTSIPVDGGSTGAF